jgi:hypothetical protein
MLSPQDLAHKVGQKVLFVGLESFSWAVADYAKAAQNARSVGFDTICCKMADGVNRWYSSPAELSAIRSAVLQQGVGFIGYTYLYGPKFGAPQVQIEAAIAKEVQDHAGGIVVLDMEVEWNGQEGSAALLAGYLKAFTGDVLVTTWSDIREQNWLPVVKQLNPVVSAWVPQEYTGFLDAAEQEYQADGVDMHKIFPAIDVAGLFAGDNPLAILADGVKRGHQSFWVWEYAAILSNINLIKSVLNLLPKISINLNGGTSTNQPSSPVVTVAPHPTASNPTTAPVTLPCTGTSAVRYGKYTIADGDTLESIAAKLHISNWYQDVFLPNKVILDAAAKAHGNVDSQKGNFIYAGTVISYPIIIAA